MKNYMKTILSGIQNWTKKEIKDSAADWNQNDSSASNYVKNRPFWKESNKKVYILESQNLTFAPATDEPPYNQNDYNKLYSCTLTDFDYSNYEIFSHDYWPNPYGFYTEYLVEWDNVLYKCIGINSYDLLLIGNESLFSSSSINTGEPFAIAINVYQEWGLLSNAMYIMTNDTSLNNHNITISYIEEGSIKTSLFPYPGRFTNKAQNSEIFNDYINNVASGDYSHAEGYMTTASGSHSHAEGYRTVANGWSHAEGNQTTTSGMGAHAEGQGTTASGTGAHAEGFNSKAIKSYAHAEGEGATASGQGSHGEGYKTIASGWGAHAEGFETVASGERGAHAEGYKTQATTDTSIAASITGRTYAGYAAHAEGYGTVACGRCSHAEGNGTKASGYDSHAEGMATTASGNYSHAEGYETEASGSYSHAEGIYTIASGPQSHAEGEETKASGFYSHAEGYGSTANGHHTHAEGLFTIAQNQSQHVQGENNIIDTAGTVSTRGTYAHIVGNGTSNSARSNAHTLDWDGNAWYSGDVYVGSTSGTNKDDGSKKLITLDEVKPIILPLFDTFYRLAHNDEIPYIEGYDFYTYYNALIQYPQVYIVSGFEELDIDTGGLIGGNDPWVIESLNESNITLSKVRNKHKIEIYLQPNFDTLQIFIYDPEWLNDIPEVESQVFVVTQESINEYEDLAEAIYNANQAGQIVIFQQGDNIFYLEYAELEPAHYANFYKVSSDGRIQNVVISGSTITYSDYNPKDYTDTAIASLVDSAPETLNTLNELATAFQENQDLTTTLNQAIGEKATLEDLNNHKNDTEIHITAAEREKWNEEQVQSDWNQNDDTAVDYVKNRTHYIENASTLFDGTLISNNDGYYTYISGAIYPNETYLISINNGPLLECHWEEITEEEYRPTVVGHSLTYKTQYQNQIIYYYSYSETNNAGFVMEADFIPQLTVLNITNSTFYPLNEKFIPDTIARTEIVTTHISDEIIHVTAEDKANWNSTATIVSNLNQGLTLTDTVTGVKYMITIANGKVTLTEVSE